MEDVNQCVMALQTQNPESLDRTAANIQGRSARICAVVDAEMLNYEPGLYTDKVSDAVLILKEQGLIFLQFLDVYIYFRKSRNDKHRQWHLPPQGPLLTPVLIGLSILDCQKISIKMFIKLLIGLCDGL